MIGLISDIHANVYGLKAALDEINKAGADSIICAGDIVGYYPFVNETIRLLKQENVLCILGNHDAILVGELAAEEERWQQYMLDYTMSVIEPDQLEWLRQLPLTRVLDLEGSSFEVYHGSPWSPLTEYVYPDNNNFERFGSLTTDYAILGHTHWPLLRRVNKVMVINPGSCGQPRDYHPGACYALLSTEDHQVSFCRATYDLQKVVAILQTLDFDPKLIEILYRTQGEDLL